MNKGRIIKTVVATSALVVLTSMTAFAKYGEYSMGNGLIYLYWDSSGSLKRAYAGTVPGEWESSYTSLTTTYDDGEEDVSSDGPDIGTTQIRHTNWEYADGYSSTHKMIRNSLGYASDTLSY